MLSSITLRTSQKAQLQKFQCRVLSQKGRNRAGGSRREPSLIFIRGASETITNHPPQTKAILYNIVIVGRAGLIYRFDKIYIYILFIIIYLLVGFHGGTVYEFQALKSWRKSRGKSMDVPLRLPISKSSYVTMFIHYHKRL